MKRIPITAAGADGLRKELNRLKHVERHRIIEAIAEARALGDLSENAEYHAARERQSFVEGRIADLESKLSLVEIIDVAKLPRTGKVVFGVTATLTNLDTGDEVTYQIVGEDEADLEQGKLSVSSPIARALIGKNEGDDIKVKVPSGELEYEITEVNYV
jgi:transcription elongation factor GreA